MQEEKVEMTIAEPERERLSFKLDTPELVDIATRIKAHQDDSRAQAKEIQERQRREQEEFSSVFAERNKELVAELLEAVGCEIPVEELSLSIDFEYFERHGIAFLTEDCPNCGGEGGGLDLGALLGRLGAQRTEF